MSCGSTTKPECPFELGECPSVEYAFNYRDSMDKLKPVDITYSAKTLHKLSVNKRGLISVVFSVGDHEYAYDYLTPVEFVGMFGFQVERHN